MATMIPLRVVALLSNVLFASYGYFGGIYPVLALHAILLPVNSFRLWQFLRLIREMRGAGTADLSIEKLIPFMRPLNIPAGQTLMHKGEKSDALFYLASGELEISEVGKILRPGAVVGEIGVFAHDQTRTATVVCLTNCRLFKLSGFQARQLYFQDRSFGLAVLQLIITRLMENNKQALAEVSTKATTGATTG
jgi:CRP-like cAMP-binding protein